MLFFACFRVSKKSNIKQSPNGTKPSGTLFSQRTRPGRLGPYVKKGNRRPRCRGRAHPHQARPPPSWAPCCSTNVLLPPIYTYVPPKIRYRAKNLIPLPQPSVPTRSHLGACSGAPPEGAPITEGFYINTLASPLKCE